MEMTKQKKKNLKRKKLIKINRKKTVGTLIKFAIHIGIKNNYFKKDAIKLQWLGKKLINSTHHFIGTDKEIGKEQ